MRSTTGLAVLEPGGALVPYAFERRDLREHDVAVRIRYCGICHTDLHYVRDGGLGGPDAPLPLVPGHEMTGDVVAVGSAVTSFAVGQPVCIGNIVDSCRVCPPCEAFLEPYCREYPTTTFVGVDRIDGTATQGGYSREYVADQRFVYHLPEGMDPAAAAPMLCAGITVYSPLKHWNVGPGSTVGIVGIGGLGHLAIKFARALGAHVVGFTTSEAKREDILRLGAHEAILSTDEAAMAAQAFRFDLILSAVSSAFPMDPYLKALRIDGTFCSLGIPDRLDFSPIMVTLGRRNISSSGSGGTLETHEMLAFAAEHGIAAEIELVKPSAVNAALDRLARGDVRYRFVLDLTGDD